MLDMVIKADRTAGKRVYLREWRMTKRMTIAALAEAMDIDHGTLSKLERGERRLNMDHVFAAADAFGIDPYRMFLDPDDFSLDETLRSTPDALRRQIVAVVETMLKTKS